MVVLIVGELYNEIWGICCKISDYFSSLGKQMGLVNVTVISFTEVKAQGDLHAPFSKRYISHHHNKQNDACKFLGRHFSVQTEVLLLFKT